MARSKGSANLAASLEVLAGAPLDAREVVQAKADLTAEGSFPYKYIGLEVYVVAENKKYRLISNDPTDTESWQEIGSGGGGGSDSYADLANKPQINSVTLTGNKTSEQLGLQEQYQYSTMPQPDFSTKLVQYIGPTNANFTHGYFYESVRDYQDAPTFHWERRNTQPSEGGASNLTDLSDVSIATPSDGQVLTYDAENHVWKNASGGSASVAELGDIGDVDLDNLVDGQTLVWDATSSKWVNGSGGSGSVDELGDIGDVNLTSPVDGQFLTYDGTNQKWVNADGGTASVDELADIGDVNLSNLTDGQVIKYDSATQKWVNANESGGGSAELQSNVTSNLAVGAIASGTTLPSGTTFTEFVQKLLITEIAPTLTMSLSKSGNVLYGQSYTETITVAVSSLGTAYKIKSIEYYEGNTLVFTQDLDSESAGTWSHTMSTATTDTTTFKTVISYYKSDRETIDTITKTASINFYYNKFYGAVNSLTPDEATVEALTTALATGKGGTYSFTVNNGRICYAYPKSLGALASIKDGNGFSLFDSFTRTEVTYTQNGTSVNYYRYVLTDATTVSGYSVVFA